MILAPDKINKRIPVLGEWVIIDEGTKFSLELTTVGCTIKETTRDEGTKYFFGIPYSIAAETDGFAFQVFANINTRTLGNRNLFHLKPLFDDLVMTDISDSKFKLVFNKVWK